MVPSLRFVRPLRAPLLFLAVTAAFMVSLGLTSAVSSTGSGPDATLTVRAKGGVGGERMEVHIGGEVVGGFTMTTEWRNYTVETASAAGAAGVEVHFTNDQVSPEDRNLWVDHVTYGGQTYQAEAPTTFGTGVWEHGAYCAPGYHHSEILACNGSFAFGDLPGSVTPPTSGEARDGSTIVVTAAGNLGEEMIEIIIDGRSVASFALGASTDLVSDPQYGEYRYVHDTTVDAEQVEVAFVNDRYRPGADRNVRIERVEIDRAAAVVTATAIDSESRRCIPGVLDRELLLCNGRLELASATAEPGAETTTTTDQPGEPTITLGTTPTTAEPTVPTTEPTTSSTTKPTAAPTTTAPTTTAPTTTAPTTTAPTIVPTTGVSTKPGGPTTPPGPVATGGFYVVGSDIVGPDGNIFYPIGANVAIKFTPYGYVFEGNNGGVNDHLDDVRAWNWNTIRATLICDNASGVPSFEELVDGIQPTIERFTEAGIVVMLECHDSTGANPRLGSAKDLRIRRFWDEMASRYHDNPYVWFNIYNEPHSNADTAAWARLHQFYIDRIRATGAENIIVADIPLWGQGIHLLADQGFADGISAECNTVFAWHAYGAINGRQGSFADHERYLQRVQAKDMAVVIGEIGVASPANWGNAGPWAWNITGFDALATLGPKYGVGLLWWHATGDEAYFSLYALKNDRSGFWTAGNGGNLTTYGQRFWDVSHQVEHDRGAFAGDVADSGCSSAR